MHYTPSYINSRLSQPEIALRLEVSQTIIHNWLSGKNKIPMEFYDRIAELCDIELSELLPDQWRLLLDRGTLNTKNQSN